MLVGDSLFEHALIRTAILGLRAIAPVSILSVLSASILRPAALTRHRWTWLLGAWLLAESAFYLAVYLPLKAVLQRPTTFPKSPSKHERNILFHRCIGNVPDPTAYFSKWFLYAPAKDIRRDNMKEFFCWSLMNKHYEKADTEEDVELDAYCNAIEDRLRYKLDEGRDDAHCLRGTIDAVPVQHRPLVWYAVVFGVDLFTCARLFYNSFRFHRTTLVDAMTQFPWRPISFLTWSPKSSARLTYWYRKHTSKTRLPIVFIHGIGVGLYTYVDFLAAINHAETKSDIDGDVGILVVEILPISARICAPALAPAQMRKQIQILLDAQGWNEVVLIGHSYGSAVAASILRDPELSKRVKATILMDPICFMLHLPDIAYNFTRRKPTKASELMLHYFSSQDIMISHTLARRFFWSDYVLWNEDIAGLPLTVTLSGRDIIVPTEHVWNYLTGTSRDDVEGSVNGNTRSDDKEWTNGALKVFWFDGFNHAGLFTSKGARRGLAAVARNYCQTAKTQPTEVDAVN